MQYDILITDFEPQTTIWGDVEILTGFFTKLKEGLTKTRENFVGKVEEVFTGRKRIDEELYEELEEVLIR